MEKKLVGLIEVVNTSDYENVNAESEDENMKMTKENSGKKNDMNEVRKIIDDVKKNTYEICDFIGVDKRGKKYLIIPKLARYIEKKEKYLLVRNNAKDGMCIYVYKNGVYVSCSEDMLKKRIKDVIEDSDIELARMSSINETYQMIMTDGADSYKRQTELNSDENVINFKNTLVRLTEDRIETIPHSSQNLSTIQIPCNWKSEEIPTPVFDSYFETLTDGDKCIQQLLLEFIGVCISNVKGFRMKKALFLVGEGNTGKSQLKRLVEAILGKENYIGMDLKQIESRFGTSMLYGRRLAGCSDMSFLSVKELSTFKNLTGGDSVFAEYKGKDGFEFTYDGLLWFCANKLPKFGGDDGPWVYNRIIVVNCVNVIPPEEQDKNLFDKMFAEREGIIQKALKALQTVIKNGYKFSEPDSVKLFRKNYMCSNNSVTSFWNECMTAIDTDCREYFTTGKVFEVYKLWCKDNNNGHYKTAKEFRDDISRFLKTDYKNLVEHNRCGNFYKEYMLKSDVVNHYIYQKCNSSEPPAFEEKAAKKEEYVVPF